MKVFFYLFGRSSVKKSLHQLFKLKPVQSVALGVLGYVLIGTVLISFPLCQKVHVSFIDNLFSIVSAVSTTGLTTVSVSQSYTWFGQFILLCMFQVGGWGFMTLTSFFFLVIRKDLNKSRESILKTSYTLPQGFDIRQFIINTVRFTLIIELTGTLLLWLFFHVAGKPDALWSALFHTVSAFATAGFSLYDNSFMDFSTNIPVNIVISILCYLGAIGFIVIQDVYYGVVNKKKVTFTSKIIVLVTLVVYIVGVLIFFLTEPSIQGKGFFDKIILSSFQVMTASTTAGFNTLDFSVLSRCVLFLIIIVMVIGASPSGTGGGIKTTSVSAFTGIINSIVRGRDSITLFGSMIPMHRVLSAVAASTVYVGMLTVGVFLLAYTESFEFEKIFFEAASAIGTVGLSTGITSSLGLFGKINIIFLMYIGRVGPLAIGISIFGKESRHVDDKHKEDLAV